MFIEDVKNRRSVRTFDGKGVSNEVIDDLKEYAGSIVNPYNIPVEFVFLNKDEYGLSSPVLSGEKEYIAAKVKKGTNADVAYGYSFEELLMYAVSKGLGTVWIGGTMPRDKFERAINLKEDEIMPCMSPIGYVANKMGMKEVLMRKGVKADSRYDFKELFFADSFDASLTEAKAEELGIKPILFNRDQEEYGGLIVNDFSELAGLMETENEE